MARSQRRCAMRDRGCGRLQSNRQIAHECVDRRNGSSSHLIRADQCLREGARRQHERIVTALAEMSNRGLVMRIGSIEESDDDPGIDNDQRHSRRSLLRYPFGYVPVRLPA